MDSKGFMKTMEVFLAIIMATVFIFYLLPQFTGVQTTEQSIRVLKNLEKNDEFRNFVTRNTGCYNNTNTTVDSFMQSYLSEDYEYQFCIAATPDALPNVKVPVDTLFMTGNLTDYSPRIVRLYYWTE
ncbi:hypothetical protein JW930_07270 [Candidatus Woesearchaeota archaeon]|nr:hypothetical protein [Candidatus Woesearchaeota archaeon]